MTRILLVDDEKQIRTFLRAVLEGTGYEVAEAGDGGEALRVYRGWRPDLVLCDLFMPNRDGLETIRDLHHEFPGAKVIAMSGGAFGGKVDLLPAADFFGATVQLRKPFNRMAVLAAIERARDGSTLDPSRDRSSPPLVAQTAGQTPS